MITTILLLYCMVFIIVTFTHVLKPMMKEDNKTYKLRSNSNHVNTLEFVHITKTGGTAIELNGESSTGIKWGSLNYNTLERTNRDYFQENELPREFLKSKTMNFVFIPWHTPPHWFKTNPYKDSKTFTVIRNPYERAVSEYYSKWEGYDGEDINNPNVMNFWIQHRATTFFDNTGHFLPQHYYIYNRQGEKMVDHILRYEWLDAEFSDLMKKYSLNIELSKKENVRTSLSKLTVADLTQETIDIINDQYSEDFTLLGYPKQSKVISY